MTNYAHPKPGETCARCPREAERVVGTQPLCTNHLDQLVGAIHRRQRHKHLTPPTHGDLTAWAKKLAQGIHDGIITSEEAAAAWNTHRGAA